MQILTWVISIIAGLGLAYGAVAAFGAWRWSVAIGDLVAQLDAGRVVPSISRYDATELMRGVTEVLCYGTAVTLERVAR